MHSRKAYMDREITHRQYYGQLVTPVIVDIVRAYIGPEAIANSNDEAFNDIPLRRWDVLAPLIRSHVPELPEGETWSLNTSICIAKEAARQIKEGHTGRWDYKTEEISG